MTEPEVDLAKAKCKPCASGTPAMTDAQISAMLAQVPGWAFRDGVLTKTFRFANYWQTIAFVNATAWISQREDHHPDLSVSYNQCRVDYRTHAIGGISHNDFICAAKLDALFAL